MGEIEVNKSVITIVNIVILMGLPFMFAWHIKQARKKEHLSDDWIIQILIIFVYGIALCAEIPALWSRWEAYYVIKMQMPEGLYKLTTWDRWNHLCFYVVLFLMTYTFTRKKIPKIIRDTLS